MRINFVTLADKTIASYRYHNEIPARELQLLGHETLVTPCPVMDADGYVFSKHFNYSDYWSLLGLKSEGRKTFFHCCDNHFKDEHTEHYRRMIEKTDTVIAPTPEMAAVIRTETARDAAIVPDTYELPLAEPAFRGLSSPKLRVLWFGHSFNLLSLKEVLPLPDFCELRICTFFKDNVIPGSFTAYPYMPWSYPNLLKALEWCDCVIIPFDITKEYNLSKSANRLMESVRQGKYVIASPIPSYEEFSPLMYIGDIHYGLEYLQGRDPSEIKETIRACQEKIELQYAPAIIGKKWAEVLCG